MQVASACEIGFITRLLDFFVAQALCFIEAFLKLGLNGERDFECERRHRCDQQFTNGPIECCARHVLAHRLGGANALALAHVVGDLLATA